MASMLKNYMWFPVLLAICYTIYWNDTYRKMTNKLINGDITGAYKLYFENNNSKNVNNAVIKLFTIDELSKFNNFENGLYLSIVGQIFDVTNGDKHYGPGGSYHAFTGRDASLAFITGEFNDDGLIDDTTQLTNSQAKSINDWIQFYHDKYIFKGKLIGRYYDQDGEPTDEFYKFKNKVKKAENDKAVDEIDKKIFPPCNIEWIPEEGTKVWCTKMSGGIPRDWLGVPMQYFDNPKNLQNRCACVDFHSDEYKNNKSKFRKYDDCSEDLSFCYLKT